MKLSNFDRWLTTEPAWRTGDDDVAEGVCPYCGDEVQPCACDIADPNHDPEEYMRQRGLLS